MMANNLNKGRIEGIQRHYNVSQGGAITKIAAETAL